jgi:3-oxoacyl-[acyl-carrier-protein] synthase II
VGDALRSRGVGFLNPVAVVAAGAVSPLGEGDAAVAIGNLWERQPTCVREDAVLSRAGLARPRAARVLAPASEGVDRAAFLLGRAVGGLVAALDPARPGWRELRVAVFIGTSCGGMDSLETVFARRASGLPLDQKSSRAATYAGPLAALDDFLDPAWPILHVLSACVSSTVALGLACRALDAGWIDLGIAGGYDALTAFAATGFEALGATTATLPRPFRRDRDGMALGEGAALVALMRAAEAPSSLGTLLGVGMTSDASHVTAPDFEGRGLARAAGLALADARLEIASVDLVSAHATATPHNDAAETKALAALFPRGAPAVVHPYKAIVGHTLGAAGILETLAALRAMRDGVLPAALGDGALEPEFHGRLLDRNERGAVRHALKLSAAFGGANAALVLAPARHPDALGPAKAQAPARGAARVLYESPRLTEPDLALIARRSRLDPIRVERLERASGLAVTAAAVALDAFPPLRGADPARVAIVVATEAGCLEANEHFDARRRERGPRGVEPRRFPATSPNLSAGLCSIAFGFTGAAFAVGGGPGALHQARRAAELLLRGGDADWVLLVTADDVGSVARQIFEAAGLPLPVDGATAVVLG